MPHPRVLPSVAWANPFPCATTSRWKPVDPAFAARYSGVPIIGDGANGMGINRNTFSERVSPELLRNLYAEKTDKEIAVRFGVSDVLVSHWRKKWGIPTVTPRQRRDRERVGLPRLDEITPVLLAELYTKMGDRQIGQRYGVQKPAILRLRRKWGILGISKSERALSKRELTEEQREIIVGVLLGDGHLLKRGAFQVSHSHSQLRYLRHLHTILSPLSRSISYYEKEMSVTGTNTYTFGFRTKMHSWLKHLRKVFYPEGTKVFPEDFLKNLTPRSLAYWYFDDGNLDSNLPSFALGDISLSEAQAVCGWVKGRFALDAYVKPASPSTCQLMGLRARTTDLFFTLIQPFLLPELLHKVPQKHRPLGSHPVRPLTTQEPHPLPKDLAGQSKQWPNLGSTEQENLLDDLVTFWEGEGFPYSQPRPEDLDVLHHLAGSQVILDGRIKRLNVGQSSCQAVMPHIWDTKSIQARESPLGLFQEDLRGVLKMVLKMGGVPNAARVRSGCRLYHYSGAYNFRPAAAKVLVDRYCGVGGLVFDPCAGWGGRLMGTILSQSGALYEGCEPQPETHAGLLQLRDWLDSYLPGVSSRVTVHKVPAEDHPFPTNVGMVLTSPPYWKKMTYGQGPLLAGNRYPTYDAWLRGFWQVVIQKSVASLKPGGWLVLNVDDVTIERVGYPLVADTKEACADLGLGEPEEFKYNMGRPGNRDNHEAVLCWPKGPGAIVSVPDHSLESLKCGTCGKPTPARGLKDGACEVCRGKKKSRPCAECGENFTPVRETAQFCSPNCGARSRRKRMREVTPAKKTRLFVCRDCGGHWETAALGRFTKCPECRDAQDRVARTKECSYRYCCQREFLDTSAKNSMTYCCVEHRRREKLFRSGKAVSVEYFQKPDPVEV